MDQPAKRGATRSAYAAAVDAAVQVTMEMELSGKRAAVLVEQQYQEMEVC